MIQNVFMLKSFIILLLLFNAKLTFAYSFSSRLGKGTSQAFTGSNKWVWYSGTALALIALKYDLDIYHHFDNKEENESINEIGDVMGTGIPGAGLAILTMGTGWLFNSDSFLKAGVSHGEGLFATFLYTSILKVLVERDRPVAFTPTENSESAFNASFPSGHTSTAFATAGNIMESTGPILGIPFLLLATATGYSRIQQQAHYAGDVIFGATLGYTMGSGFYKSIKSGGGLSLQVVPIFSDRENFGILISSHF